jgi:glycosyltransferase involved in cell wall biosynthesis
VAVIPPSPATGGGDPSAAPIKVFVQIPCLNEEATLPLVLQSIPRSLPGIASVEVIVIDDGSTDATTEVAQRFGVEHIIVHKRTMGLARSFHDGVTLALELGADVLVNTDGDNQYPQDRIPDLVEPIVDGTADIVIADRQTATIEHFSPLKKALQRLGTWVVNKAAGTDLPDAASGFRAYSRYALTRLNVVTEFSYCMETIIQAGNQRLATVSIPVTTNPELRKSRMFSNIWEHVFRSMSAIVRAYVMYKPRVVFMAFALVCLIAGLVPFIRFAYLASAGDHPGGHVQSLIVGTVLFIGAGLSVVLGVLADLIRVNRILLEESLERDRARSSTATSAFAGRRLESPATPTSPDLDRADDPALMEDSAGTSPPPTPVGRHDRVAAPAAPLGRSRR